MKKLFVMFAIICMLFVSGQSRSVEKAQCEKLQLKCGDHVIEEFSSDEMLEIMKYRSYIQAENEGRLLLKNFPENPNKVFVFWLNKDGSILKGLVFNVTFNKTEPL